MCNSHLAKCVQVWGAMAEAGNEDRACLGTFAERVCRGWGAKMLCDEVAEAWHESKPSSRWFKPGM